ncbi:MAG: hypothetical protein GKS02_00150 [Alphaproteobacteria bacterium]|nr:hypothetical protein [Alphaproteobacteria bacterium]
MVWALVFVLVTTSVAETWDTGMRFNTLEECRRAAGALADNIQSSQLQGLEQRQTGEIKLTDWEWSCLPHKA